MKLLNPVAESYFINLFGHYFDWFRNLEKAIIHPVMTLGNSLKRVKDNMIFDSKKTDIISTKSLRSIQHK